MLGKIQKFLKKNIKSFICLFFVLMSFYKISKYYSELTFMCIMFLFSCFLFYYSWKDEKRTGRILLTSIQILSGLIFLLRLLYPNVFEIEKIPVFFVTMYILLLSSYVVFKLFENNSSQVNKDCEDTKDYH